MSEIERPQLPNGIVVFVKRDCPTCETVAPVLRELAKQVDLSVYTQDDLAFPEGVESIDDRELEMSWHWDIEAVPTLIRVEGGSERERLLGWHREEWQQLTGVDGLGDGLPDWRPGCGSLSVAPDRVDDLRARFGGGVLRSRRVELAELEDEYEAMVERGWSDGLPLIPPTEKRVLAMLSETHETRKPG